MLGFTLDTSLDLTGNFHSRSIGGDGANVMRYRNPEVDRLIVEAASQPELAAMKSQLDQVQQIIHRDQPVTFLWESQAAERRQPAGPGRQAHAQLRVLQSQGVVDRAGDGLDQILPAAPRRLAASPLPGPHVHFFLPPGPAWKSPPGGRGRPADAGAAGQPREGLRPRPPPGGAVPGLAFVAGPGGPGDVAQPAAPGLRGARWRFCRQPSSSPPPRSPWNTSSPWCWELPRRSAGARFWITGSGSSPSSSSRSPCSGPASWRSCSSPTCGRFCPRATCTRWTPNS